MIALPSGLFHLEGEIIGQILKCSMCILVSNNSCLYLLLWGCYCVMFTTEQFCHKPASFLTWRSFSVTLVAVEHTIRWHLKFLNYVSNVFRDFLSQLFSNWLSKCVQDLSLHSKEPIVEDSFLVSLCNYVKDILLKFKC